MGKREAAADAKAVLFKRLYGVKPDVFEKMKSILQKEFDILHRRGGKPPKLTIEDKLYITLKYLREYRTMESTGGDYGVGKSAVCETIQWVEDALIKDKTFRLPDKKVLKRGESSIEYIVVDVTESPINRPKKTKKSGVPARKSVIR
ncbi:MAG: transposase family protein [Spirochaetaceae bacterium]|jgi:hypothetical protein|nr:transposase family protein [Spirochaetaceae bacterium]